MENILKRNNVRILGQGEKTIIFGHGFGCDQNIWRAMLPYFEKNYRIIIYDYVGSGNSETDSYSREKYQNLYGYSQDLQDILNALEIKNAIFVGHSVSSIIGLLTSIKDREYFEKLILICPSPRYLNDLPEYFGGFDDNDIKEILTMMEMNFVGWATANAAMLMDNPDRPMLAEQLKDTFVKENPFIMKDFAQATFMSDHRKELPEVSTPTLIIQCSVDSIVPIQVAEYLHANLKESTLKVIDARGHYPNLSRPKETAELILEYINNF